MIRSFQMMGPFWCCQRLSQKHSVTNRSADMTLRAASDFSALDVAAWRDQWNTEKNCPSLEGMTQCKGHCKMFFWSLELSSLISGQWWRGKNCTRNLPPPLLKSPWHRGTSLRDGMGYFEARGRGVLPPSREEANAIMTQDVDSAPTAPAWCFTLISWDLSCNSGFPISSRSHASVLWDWSTGYQPDKLRMAMDDDDDDAASWL